MNHLINPGSWYELKNKLDPEGIYKGLCFHSDWFKKHWEIREDRKLLRKHARNFLKTVHHSGWVVQSGFLFWHYNSLNGFNKIRIDFCEYMIEHCTESPYTKWEQFAITVKSWFK